MWVRLSSGGRTRLTAHPKEDFNPVWSPDGDQLVFVYDRKGVRDLFIKGAPANAAEHPAQSRRELDSRRKIRALQRGRIGNHGSTGDWRAYAFSSDRRTWLP